MSTISRPTLLILRSEEELQEMSGAIARFKGPNFSVSLSPKGAGPFREFIREEYAKGCRHFVTCGGDGSLNLLVDALLSQGLGKDASVGIVPTGTANDFASAIGMIAEDPEAALSEALFAPVQRADVASVEGRYFINVLSGGNLAKVTREVSPELKAQWGRVAYFLKALVELSRLEYYPCSVVADGVEKNVLLSGLAIGNGRQAGGGFKVGESSELNDCKLEVMLLPELSATEMAKLAFEARKPEPDFSFDCLDCFQASDLTIECDRVIPLNLDGEAWESAKFRVQVHPLSLGIAQPRRVTGEEPI